MPDNQHRRFSHAEKLPTKRRYRALTLVELLCVIAIIAILLALYLPAMARAFGQAKNFLFGE